MAPALLFAKCVHVHSTMQLRKMGNGYLHSLSSAWLVYCLL